MREAESGYNSAENLAVISKSEQPEERLEQDKRSQQVEFLINSQLHSKEELDSLGDDELEALYLGTKDLIEKAKPQDEVLHSAKAQPEIVELKQVTPKLDQETPQVQIEKKEEPQTPQSISENKEIAERIAQAKAKKKPYATVNDLKSEMKKLLDTEQPEWKEVSQMEDQLKSKGLRVVRGLGLTAEQNLAAYKKLESVAHMLPKDAYQNKFFKPANQRDTAWLRPDGTIVFDHSRSESELHDELINVLELKKESAEKSRLDYVTQKIASQEQDSLKILKDNLEGRPQAPETSKTAAKANEKEVVLGPENVEFEKLDFNKLKPETKPEVAPTKFSKISEALKSLLKDKYTEFMKGTLGISARELNKLQDMSVQDFLSQYSHDQVSPAWKKEKQGLAEYLEKNKEGDEQKTIREVLLAYSDTKEDLPKAA